MLQALPLRLVSVRTATTLAFHQARRRRGGFSHAAMAPAGRGALIVFEGLDRSGKSSQCAHLTSFLQAQGVAVEAWRFPDRTTATGHMISSYLSCQTDLHDAAIHLLFSANRWEKRYDLLPLESISMPFDDEARVCGLRIWVRFGVVIVLKGRQGLGLSSFQEFATGKWFESWGQINCITFGDSQDHQFCFGA